MIPKKAQSLPKSAKKIWLIHNMIVFVIFLAIGLIINIFLKFNWHSPLVLGVNGLCGIILLLVIGNIILIPYHYRFYKYMLNQEAISIYKGFFLRKSQTIPLNRIQNVDTVQGPILQICHLQNVSIVTAAHAFKIEAINEDVAHYLRDQLITAARQAREVDTDD
ncbi:PH domain-containing protein [Leuconostoc gasicomitatum]|uniref:YdbS-like PH domain-containing protein n=1 Tax=Leuconostoc gasicomitatum TaxID=115778 RepID=A0ABM9V2D4_9LACO|nr:PH domain-containing protein [Leuconostoc gasicomitatum]MBZ5946362.1 PH domain-containing protein [Leuconostoc gasicomitatum]MBZ5950187.1 PH domain-containing protein [Leuconostoc gasicomitatum]MBZ5952745.1 PH domain-containing protein [Leuconostoc gasicomitatum]MBZ5954352.1 PH domain-containing protein [Leuconostoc gasicomitatum]MBZ5969617.1 PH domain-containing protein [Leuconostoc gasicomitatum]